MHKPNYRSEVSSASPDGGGMMMPSIEVVGNSIYFYSEVSPNKVLALNKALKETSTRILIDSIRSGNQPAPIWLYIMSPGGDIFAGLSAMDTIEEIRKTVPVYTVVDGYSASAGTFISLAGSKRFIRPNSFMMIHQLSSAVWGRYEDIKDEMQNLDLFMQIIQDIYKKRTTVPTKQLGSILKKDLWWTAAKCKSLCLVDEII